MTASIDSLAPERNLTELGQLMPAEMGELASLGDELPSWLSDSKCSVFKTYICKQYYTERVGCVYTFLHIYVTIIFRKAMDLRGRGGDIRKAGGRKGEGENFKIIFKLKLKQIKINI